MAEKQQESSVSVTILLPAFNEEQAIADTIHKIKELYPDFEVLVIDDGSTDNTMQAAMDAGANVWPHPYNIGNGAAVKTGLRMARGEWIVMMDADGQHDPEDIEKLVQPILSDEADFVIGSRVLGECADYSRFRMLGVHVFSRLINFIVGTNITDCSSGYRAIRGSVLDECLLLQEQYHTAEVIIEAAKRGFRITERPVTIACRLSGESKKGHDLKYGLFFLRTIIKTWLR